MRESFSLLFSTANHISVVRGGGKGTQKLTRFKPEASFPWISCAWENVFVRRTVRNTAFPKLFLKILLHTHTHTKKNSGKKRWNSLVLGAKILPPKLFLYFVSRTSRKISLSLSFFYFFTLRPVTHCELQNRSDFPQDFFANRRTPVPFECTICTNSVPRFSLRILPLICHPPVRTHLRLANDSIIVKSCKSNILPSWKFQGTASVRNSKRSGKFSVECAVAATMAYAPHVLLFSANWHSKCHQLYPCRCSGSRCLQYCAH